MTDSERHQEILALIEERTRQGTRSKAAARQMLIDEGIYTAKGNLRKEFGGRGARKYSIQLSPQANG